MYNGIKMLTAS